jgi:hypothetical protein
MIGGVLRRLWAGRLAIAAAAAAAIPGFVVAGVSKAAPARQAVMPAAYYGMDEAERNDGLLREVVLMMHNEERESLGLSPLAWDDRLAQDAARYARQMASTNRFQHSPRASRAIPSGENLWMGPRRLYDYEVMIGAFLDEKRLFRRAGKLPNVSTSGRWEDVGHYTQMIWRGTRKVGCALADGQDYEYLVCRYYPAGNEYGKGPFDADDSPRGSQFAGVGE